MNAFAFALNQSWAMLPSALADLLAIAAREESNRELAASIRTERDTRMQAVLTTDGRPLDGTRDVQVRDGVALVPVMGPIFRHSNLFTEWSGGATIETLSRDFATALNAPGVRAIVLHIDSPGGEITGVAQFAAQVYAARGTKPVVAYVDGLGASAAYWIGSAAGEMVLDQTALVGSIGVVQAMPNPAARTARDIEIVSSQSPNKRVDVTTERGRATIQATVDELADIFITAVALHRNVSAETVVSDFGEGGVLVGRSAVAAGMADRVESLEATIARLARDMTTGAGRGRASARQETRRMPGAQDQELLADMLTQPADARLAAMERENAALQERLAAIEAERQQALVQQRQQAAAQWAETHIAAQRFTPAARADLEAVYATCTEHGATAHLEAIIAATPVTPITGEQTVPTTPLVLDRHATNTTEDAAAKQVAAYNKNVGGIK